MSLLKQNSSKMTNVPLSKNQAGYRPGVVMLGILLVVSALADGSRTPKPTESELVRLVGQRMPSAFTSVEWKTEEPPQTNLTIYAVVSPEYDEDFLKRLGRSLGVQGEPVRIPSDFLGAPGYWIKEPNPTNHLTWESVYFSQVAGQIGYASGEDNHRWDINNHRPTAYGVPTPDDALQRTIALLPIFGIATNDLERNPDGTIRWKHDTDGTSYNDRADGKRKRYVRQMNITIWQKVPGGGSTLSVGSGGVIRSGFMSGGKLAEFECLFRKLKPQGRARARINSELVSMLRRGDGRTFRQTLPESITVTNCSIVYPQGNMMFKQTSVWPFYAVSGFGVAEGKTNVLSVYVSPEW
jgi:hypothetical protein